MYEKQLSEIIWDSAQRIWQVDSSVNVPQDLNISDFLKVPPVPVQASLLGLHGESSLNIADRLLETATLG